LQAKIPDTGCVIAKIGYYFALHFMKITNSNQDPFSIRADAHAVLVQDEHQLTRSGEKANFLLKGNLKKELTSTKFPVRKRSTLLYYTGLDSPSRIICIAIKKEDPYSSALREAAFTAVRAASSHGLTTLVLAFDSVNESETQAVVEGALLASYQFLRYKTSQEKNSGLTSVTIVTRKLQPDALRIAEVNYRAVSLVKDLVNEPPDSLTPSKFAKEAEKIAQKNNLKSRVFLPDELQKMGAFAFLSVGQGSKEQGRMVHLTYEPKKKSKLHVALVGKGITFDSGGLSLKPEKAMEHMKYDMTGAATALACVRAVAELQLPIKVTALLMATENMPGGGANRPGDVVRSMNGKTIEITNTDAEGRLALADGLTYAQTLKPDYIIDIATLTGAQVVGLGRLIGGVMGNDDDFVQEVTKAAKDCGETLWPLPLFEPYREMIKSDIADIRNSSGIPEAGTIQAGLFLSEFVEHPRWVHLDIAGPAWQERDSGVYGKAASGFGVRCLLNLLIAKAKN
jgi:leucyl aminopeptidase